jgi:asparagine synthase (glutamine-hydrolysing)
MCGIAVILPNSAMRASPFAIERMTQALAHRGPDAQAVTRLDHCHLGHTRLSVIDLATGQQPMPDPTGRYTIVFNGEIYNYRTLRRELERLGHAFVTTSDTEVLLHACIEFRSAAPSRLNGQFAFAFWDAHERAMLVARDRFGEKPLYWATTPGGDWLAASEIKAILASELIEPRIDPLAVDAYLGLHYVPPDRTIYSNIYALRPGHVGTWSDGRFESAPYWQPTIGGNRIDADEAVTEIARLIDQAVHRQMIADVPVGAFLSGGLDSSTIVALMTRHSSSPVRTFSVGFGNLIDELPFARDVADMYATEHHELQMNIDVPQMLRRMMDVYDEPFADSSNIPSFLIAQHARRHLKVVLSGDGGDELFGGYEWYRPLCDQPADDCLDQHLARSTHASADRSALWGGHQPRSRDMIAARYRPADSVRGIDRAVAFDCACYLPGDILVKVDRAAMAHGLETRAPFLDVDLAEFVLNLPAKLRFRNGPIKNLLRRASGDLWPASVRTRSKQGFGAPVRAWLELPDVAAMWNEAIRADGPLNALLPGLHRIVDDLRPQRKWTLLCLAQWLEARTPCLASLP